MQGRRLPDDTDIDKWGWQSEGRSAEPGDYIVLPDRDAVWVCLPSGVTARIPIKDSGHNEAVWGFTEHEDETITLSPSIWHDAHSDPPGWHGFLERGVWRSV